MGMYRGDEKREELLRMVREAGFTVGGKIPAEAVGNPNLEYLFEKARRNREMLESDRYDAEDFVR